MVFVAGGMTYSEMRTAYLKSASLGKDVYIGEFIQHRDLCSYATVIDVFVGSTHIITPEGFIDDLKVLELGGAGSKSLYEGVRGRGVAAPNYQIFYDKKYFVPDPAPPTRTTSAPIPDNSRLIPSRLTSTRSVQSANFENNNTSTGTSDGASFSLREFAGEKKKEKKRFFRF